LDGPHRWRFPSHFRVTRSAVDAWCHDQNPAGPSINTSAVVCMRRLMLDMSQTALRPRERAATFGATLHARKSPDGGHAARASRVLGAKGCLIIPKRDAVG